SGAGGAATNDPRPLLTLRPAGAEPGGTVEFFDTAISGGALVTRSLGFASYDATVGAWSLRVGVPLADGPHLVTARVTAAAGTASEPGPPLVLAVDTAAPAAPAAPAWSG